MGTLNTAAILAKYKRNTSQAVQDYTTGVMGVTQSPTQKAAAAVDKYAAGVQDAVSSGRFVAALQAVTLNDWQQASTGKGARNYATGTQNLSPAAQKAMADQQQFAAQVSAEVQNMANMTENDAEQRMLTAMRRMREYRKSR